jgi:hypothetical protein
VHSVFFAKLDERRLICSHENAEKTGMKTLAKILAVQTLILSVGTVVSAQQYTDYITNLAAKSSCTSYNWKNRGRAPAGYIKGMALSYARGACRTRLSPVPNLARIMAGANTQNTKKDALAHYQNIFFIRGMSTSVAGESTLRALYTLGIGLGMRESSGAYCEGWDSSAGSNRPSAQAEAGLFQTSYDSMAISSELRRLYEEYQANTRRCMLNTFKQGASCRAQSVLGTGEGAKYQAFNKTCPAFAAEYAMTMLRMSRTHYGPINRQEAEVVPACNSLLKSVQTLIDSNPEAVCNEIY